MVLEKRKLKFPIYLLFYLLFTFSAIISKYIVNDLPLRFDSNLSEIIFLISALLFFLIIESNILSFTFIRTSIRIMKYLVFTAAIVTIIQYFIPAFFVYAEKYTGAVADISIYERRIVSIFSWGDLMFDSYMAIGFVIMYGILIVEYRNNRTMLILLPILAAIVTVLSLMRVAMLTFLISTFILVYKKISVKTIMNIAITLLAFYLLFYYLDFDVWIFSEARLESETALTRIEAFSAFFYAFPEHILWGTGGERTLALFRGFGRIARLHNAHLSIAYYYGLFAIIFHTLFIIFLTKSTFNTGKEANYWPPFVGMLCYIAATMTMPRGDFFEPGLIFLIIFNKYYYDQYLIKKQIGYENIS